MCHATAVTELRWLYLLLQRRHQPKGVRWLHSYKHCLGYSLKKPELLVAWFVFSLFAVLVLLVSSSELQLHRARQGAREACYSSYPSGLVEMLD